MPARVAHIVREPGMSRAHDAALHRPSNDGSSSGSCLEPLRLNDHNRSPNGAARDRPRGRPRRSAPGGINQASFVQGDYGAIDPTARVSAASPADPADARVGTAGYPLAGIELRTDDADSENGVGAAEGVGRLRCRQRNGTDGYLILEDGWRFEPHRDDEWFEMGDLAKIREDGYLETHGRATLSVKRDGLLVVFADVEAALEKADGVQRAVVVASGESARGSRLIGVCLSDRAGQGPPPDAVRRTCLDLLPRYAVPDEVVIVETLPQLPSGKVDRHALRAWLASSHDLPPLPGS
jgi:acyl-CoA synthetase (AMP-forming)/AMP-acid ligase II